MAKNTAPAALDSADTSSPLEAVPVATPENTPIPGGGRWVWNPLSGAWDDADPVA